MSSHTVDVGRGTRIRRLRRGSIWPRNAGAGENAGMDTDHGTPDHVAGTPDTDSDASPPAPEPRTPTGSVETTKAGPVLHLARELQHPPTVVWDHLTDPTLLGGWYGTWTGEPSSGSVQLAMVEAPDSPGECRIRRCERGHALEVTLADPEGNAWQLDLGLAERPDGGTHLTFQQPLGGFEGMAADVGPGWEYYLDRLAASLDGRDVESVVWEAYWPHQREHYVVGSPGRADSSD